VNVAQPLKGERVNNEPFVGIQAHEIVNRIPNLMKLFRHVPSFSLLSRRRLAASIARLGGDPPDLPY
jgi:hypothetical protein